MQGSIPPCGGLGCKNRGPVIMSVFPPGSDKKVKHAAVTREANGSVRVQGPGGLAGIGPKGGAGSRGTQPSPSWPPSQAYAVQARDRSGLQPLTPLPSLRLPRPPGFSGPNFPLWLVWRSRNWWWCLGPQVNRTPIGGGKRRTPYRGQPAPGDVGGGVYGQNGW